MGVNKLMYVSHIYYQLAEHEMTVFIFRLQVKRYRNIFRPCLDAKRFWIFATVVFSFVCDKYCPIMD
jgi:hypothetical protein